MPTADLIGAVGQAVFALELFDDRRLQLGNAVNGGVFGLPRVDSLDRSFLDEIRRIEIWLAGPKADDITASSFELARQVGNGNGRRRLDRGQTFGQDGHGQDAPGDGQKLP